MMPTPTTASAYSLAHTGRVDEAVAAYRKAIALKPDYAESHCNLGSRSGTKESSRRL